MLDTLWFLHTLLGYFILQAPKTVNCPGPVSYETQFPDQSADVHLVESLYRLVHIDGNKEVVFSVRSVNSEGLKSIHVEAGFITPELGKLSFIIGPTKT